MVETGGRPTKQSAIPSWLVSWPSIVGFSVLLCGSGLSLLWLRPTTSTKVKATVTGVEAAGLAIVFVAAGNSPDRASNTANQVPPVPGSATTESVVDPWVSIPA